MATDDPSIEAAGGEWVPAGAQTIEALLDRVEELRRVIVRAAYRLESIPEADLKGLGDAIGHDSRARRIARALLDARIILLEAEPLEEDKIRPSFTCPDCGRTSHHPEDARNRYCGNCHVFVEDKR